MGASALFAVFVVGLLGGVHCVGMCGGIVAALSSAPGRIAQGARKRPPPWSLQLAFNGGRIATYALAGALAGVAGSMAFFLEGLLPVQVVLYAFANLMLIGLGLYLLGITRYIAMLERVGARLWRVVRPVAGRLMPADSVPRALGLGALWGWMPCGLVYSMLATALVSGSAVNGAALMAAFGLGTLPNLLFAGALMRWLSSHRAGSVLRRVAGATVLALGALGIAHAGGVGKNAVTGILCFTQT